MGLYAIVDTDALAACGLDPMAFAEAVLAAHPSFLQLRAKGLGSGEVLELLRALSPRARAAGVPLFANDRPDLAALADCDGVHVGQDDVPVAVARAVADKSGHPLAIGLSTHDAAQVDRGAVLAPDYLAIGPVFPTTSKTRPDAVLGVMGLAALAARARAARPGMPLVAIGGIGADSAEAIARIVDHVAVIGALLPARSTAHPLADVRARAERLVALTTRDASADSDREAET